MYRNFSVVLSHVWSCLEGWVEARRQMKMLEMMSSTGAEAPESSPRQLLQVLLADRTPHSFYVLVCYLLSIFLCEFSFCFPKELHRAFSSPMFLGARNTELSKICIKPHPVCDTFLKLLDKRALTFFCQRAVVGYLHLPALTEMWPSTLQRGQLFIHPCSTAKPRRQLEPDPKIRICSCCWFP